jgi:hypothetical protein
LLVTVNVNTWQTRPVGPLMLGDSELSGSPDGRLFAFNGTVSQVDPSSAAVLATFNAVNLPVGTGWAFAYWGGDFFLFTGQGVSSTVTRFRPTDNSLVNVATLRGEVIVGAGVSTCAP